MNDDGFGGLFCDKCADQYRTDNDIDSAITYEQQWEKGAYASIIVFWDYDRDNTNCDSCKVECDIDTAAVEYSGEDSQEAVAARRYNDTDNHFGRDEEYWS
jgi:hypothetical protein